MALDMTPNMPQRDNCGAILLVDFKLTKDNQIRICEFGCGINSTFTGYDCFFENRGDHLREKTLIQLAADFDQIICKDAGIIFDHQFFGQIYQTIEVLKGKKINNICNIKELAENNLYLVSSSEKILSSLPQGKKVAVINYATESKGAFRETFFEKQKIKERDLANSPFFLNGTDALSLLAEDKFMYSKFAREANCELKPRDQLIHFDICSDIEIAGIIDDFCQKPFVIKPTNSAGGSGVLIARDKGHATLLLSAIKHKKYDPEQLILTTAEKAAMDFWLERTEESDRFCLIQEYVHAKALTIEKKSYQPTGRLVFYVYYINNVRHFKIIDGYWKLPRASEGQLSVETAISHITEEEGEIANSTLIDQETMVIIQNQFEEKIGPLLDYVFSLDGKKVLREMLNSNNIVERAYAIYELSNLVGDFFDFSNDLNNADIREYVFKVLEKNKKKHDCRDRIDTIFYQVAENYQLLKEDEKKYFLDLLYARYLHRFPSGERYGSCHHLLLVFLLNKYNDQIESKAKISLYAQLSEIEKEAYHKLEFAFNNKRSSSPSNLIDKYSYQDIAEIKFKATAIEEIKAGYNLFKKHYALINIWSKGGLSEDIAKLKLLFAEYYQVCSTQLAITMPHEMLIISVRKFKESYIAYQQDSGKALIKNFFLYWIDSDDVREQLFSELFDPAMQIKYQVTNDFLDANFPKDEIKYLNLSCYIINKLFLHASTAPLKNWTALFYQCFLEAYEFVAHIDAYSKVLPQWKYLLNDYSYSHGELTSQPEVVDFYIPMPHLINSLQHLILFLQVLPKNEDEYFLTDLGNRVDIQQIVQNIGVQQISAVLNILSLDKWKYFFLVLGKALDEKQLVPILNELNKEQWPCFFQALEGNLSVGHLIAILDGVRIEDWENILKILQACGVFKSIFHQSSLTSFIHHYRNNSEKIKIIFSSLEDDFLLFIFWDASKLCEISSRLSNQAQGILFERLKKNNLFTTVFQKKRLGKDILKNPKLLFILESHCPDILKDKVISCITEATNEYNKIVAVELNVLELQTNQSPALQLLALLTYNQNKSSLSNFNYFLASHFLQRKAESDEEAEQIVQELKTALEIYLDPKLDAFLSLCKFLSVTLLENPLYVKYIKRNLKASSFFVTSNNKCFDYLKNINEYLGNFLRSVLGSQDIFHENHQVYYLCNNIINIYLSDQVVSKNTININPKSFLYFIINIENHFQDMTKPIIIFSKLNHELFLISLGKRIAKAAYKNKFDANFFESALQLLLPFKGKYFDVDLALANLLFCCNNNELVSYFSEKNPALIQKQNYQLILFLLKEWLDEQHHPWLDYFCEKSIQALLSEYAISTENSIFQDLLKIDCEIDINFRDIFMPIKIIKEAGYSIIDACKEQNIQHEELAIFENLLDKDDISLQYCSCLLAFMKEIVSNNKQSFSKLSAFIIPFEALFYANKEALIDFVHEEINFEKAYERYLRFQQSKNAEASSIFDPNEIFLNFELALFSIINDVEDNVMNDAPLALSSAALPSQGIFALKPQASLDIQLLSESENRGKAQVGLF